MNPEPYRGRKTDSHKRKKSSLGNEGGCCPMVAAVRSVKRGRYRLAARYARLSVRLIAARLA